MCEYLNIPMSILPEVKPSSMVYGKVAGGIIGLEDLEGIPNRGGYRRSAGGSVRSGMLRARSGEEHLRYRLLPADEHGRKAR